MKKTLVSLICAAFILSTFSCKKDDNTSTTTTNSSDVTAYYKSSFTFDSRSFNWEDGKSSTFQNFSSSYAKSIVKDSAYKPSIADSTKLDTIRFRRVFFKDMHTAFITNKGTREMFRITLDSLIAQDTTDTWLNLNLPPNEAFYKLFDQKITYLYRSPGNSNNVTIEFTDSTGKVWKSSLNPQTSATFSLVNLYSGTSGPNKPGYVKVDMNYECTLFNGTDSKAIKGTSRFFFLNN